MANGHLHAVTALLPDKKPSVSIEEGAGWAHGRYGGQWFPALSNSSLGYSVYSFVTRLSGISDLVGNNTRLCFVGKLIYSEVT
jgi:hypothetical protein